MLAFILTTGKKLIYSVVVIAIQNQMQQPDMRTIYDRLGLFIKRHGDERIVLLRHKEVLQWIFGDVSFLASAAGHTNKMLEDTWGQNILRQRRPDLKLDKQWTNRFGEYVCEEIYTLHQKCVSKPAKQNHYQPDLETEDAIIEVKTATYFTTGTACEKILGCPFKYAEVPDLYGKPLHIVCLGGAEQMCRNKYGNLGCTTSPQKRRFLDFFKENHIEYVAATDILRRLIYGGGAEDETR